MKKIDNRGKRQAWYRIAQGIDLNPDSLSKNRTVSKSREREIEKISARALSALSA